LDAQALNSNAPINSKDRMGHLLRLEPSPQDNPPSLGESMVIVRH